MRALGEDVAAYGFLGGHVGEALREMTIADMGSSTATHRSRTGHGSASWWSTPSAGHTTMLNEPGPPVPPEETARFLDDLRADCEPGDIVILSGSLPDSVDPAVAGEIIAIGNEAGARTRRRHPQPGPARSGQPAALDGQVQPRSSCWATRVDATDPGELERYRAQPLPALARDMQRLRETGIEIVVVTLGDGGALLDRWTGWLHVARPTSRGRECHRARATCCWRASSVGLERGQPAREALILGAACGTVAATRLPAELPPDFDPDEWLPRISVEPVEPAR